jgi:hypothetical protein
MLVKQATCKYVHEWLVYVHEHSDLVSTLESRPRYLQVLSAKAFPD